MTQKTKEQLAREHAAERRQDYLRALNEEREGCERVGKVDRVKAIDAEIERVSSSVKDRTDADSQKVAAAPVPPTAPPAPLGPPPSAPPAGAARGPKATGS